MVSYFFFLNTLTVFLESWLKVHVHTQRKKILQTYINVRFLQRWRLSTYLTPIFIFTLSRRSMQTCKKLLHKQKI